MQSSKMIRDIQAQVFPVCFLWQPSCFIIENGLLIINFGSRCSSGLTINSRVLA
jgi:hypothetical protein